MITMKRELTPQFPHLLHGGDYNPDQWLDEPDILEKDIYLMKQAHINCVSLGIFSWAHLEPTKDVFTFEWLDEIIDRLYKNGIYVDLATPSGARPHWLAKEYPEVLRVDEMGIRAKFGGRHNHCLTSPVYRERVAIINRKLAERYGKHPAVILWHISNEYSGECRCELCQQAFRDYLRDKYGDIQELNHSWWSRFWSHTYSDFDEVEAPGSNAETAINGLWLDWRRFVTYQTVQFMKNEIETVKSVTPDIPVTTNLMGLFDGLCYPELAKEVDIVSWDSYPSWHEPGKHVKEAYSEAFTHDYIRCLKHCNFLLMECTPSAVNWRPVSKLKKPGMHKLAVLGAIGHGAESGMYFQIRQSRGSAEKFHSAVISHVGTESTRVFKEVAELGKCMDRISEEIYGSEYISEVAIIYDKESKWALDLSQGPRNQGLDYDGICTKYYQYFWNKGINVDVIDSRDDFSGYKLCIAPMLYSFQNGIQEKLRNFVNDGGVLLTTALSGITDENDLCYLGEGSDEKLTDVLGMWVEEYDGLYDEEYNTMILDGKGYRLSEICEIIHTTSAKTLAVYEKDFYKGTPVFCVNNFGRGKAYHLAANAEQSLINEICRMLISEVAINAPFMDSEIPDGVGISVRKGDLGNYIFVGNYSDKPQTIDYSQNEQMTYVDILTGQKIKEHCELDAYEIKILREMSNT